MTTYFTTLGLQGVAQSESGGDPTTCNSSGHCGLYQFDTNTWQEYAPDAGVDVNQYPTANLAPADVQTSVAGVTPIGAWTGNLPGQPPWNPTAVQLAQDPNNVTNTPGTAYYTNFTTPSNTPDYFDTTNIPGQGNPTQNQTTNTLDSSDGGTTMTMNPPSSQGCDVDASGTYNCDVGVTSPATAQSTTTSGSGLYSPTTGLPVPAGTPGGVPLSIVQGIANATGTGGLLTVLQTDWTDMAKRIGLVLLGLLLVGFALYAFVKVEGKTSVSISTGAKRGAKIAGQYISEATM